MRRTFLTVVIAITAGVAAPALHAGSNVAGYASAASDGHRTHVNLGAGYSPGPQASFMDWCRQPIPGGAGSHRLLRPSGDHIVSSDGPWRPGVRRIGSTVASGLDRGMDQSFGAGDFYSSAVLSDGRMVETSFRTPPVGQSISLEPRALRAGGQGEFVRQSGAGRNPDSSTFLMLLLGGGLIALVVRRRI